MNCAQTAYLRAPCEYRNLQQLISSHSINQSVFVILTEFLLCEVGTDLEKTEMDFRLQLSVPWFMLLDVSHAPRKTGFDHGLAHMRFLGGAVVPRHLLVPSTLYHSTNAPHSRSSKILLSEGQAGKVRIPWNKPINASYIGHHWTEKVQIGRSPVRSQLVSLEFFIDIKSFRSHYGPAVDTASNRNENSLGVKAAGA